MEILIKNLQQGDKKYSGIIEMLSNYGVEYSVHQPVLQQTDCYTALEFLEQMLSKEQKDFGKHYFITDEVSEKISKINNIQSVIQLIKKRQANAV